MKTPPILRYFPPTDTRKTDEGKYQFVISDESADRHGTIIPIDAWDLRMYRKNPIVAYQHQTSGGFITDPDPDYIIGKARVFIEDKKLIGEVEFESPDINPLAEKIRQKIEFGSLRATSVGFLGRRGHWGDPEQDEDKNIYYFEKAELLEFSIVNIPSNPNAIKRSFHDFIDTQKKEIKPEPEPGTPVDLLRAVHILNIHKIKNARK